MLQRPAILIPDQLCTAAPPQGKPPGPRGPAVWGSPRLWGGLAPQRPGRDGGLLGRRALSRQFQRIGEKTQGDVGVKKAYSPRSRGWCACRGASVRACWDDGVCPSNCRGHLTSG